MSWKKIILALILASLSFALGAYVKQREETGDRERHGVTSKDVTAWGGSMNILLIGEDDVRGSKRSDTVALIALDSSQKSVKILSLPRDTRVSIPGHGIQKLNHAYAYGKETLLGTTVEHLLGVDIPHYIKVNYDNFPQLVDSMGGVDIYVANRMKYDDVAGDLHIDIPPGKQRMNGKTALQYVRFRSDAMGDIGRVGRQQLFLKAVMARMYAPENLLRFGAIIDEASRTLITNIDAATLLRLGWFVRGFEKDMGKIFFMMLPGSAATIDGASYWIADLKKTRPLLEANPNELTSMDKKSGDKTSASSVTSAAQFSTDAPGLSADPQGTRREETKKSTPATTSGRSELSREELLAIINNMPEAVAVLNGTGRSGVGQRVAAILQRMGVDVTHVSNAKHFDYRSSKIVHPEGADDSSRKTAELLARLCGIGKSLTNSDKQASYPSLIVGHNYEALIRRLENQHAIIR